MNVDDWRAADGTVPNGFYDSRDALLRRNCRIDSALAGLYVDVLAMASRLAWILDADRAYHYLDLLSEEAGEIKKSKDEYIK